MKAGTLYRTLLIWRARHISKRQFILILSILIGMGAGLASYLLKQTVRLIQVLQTRLIERQTAGFDYGEFVYLTYPLLGLVLCLLFVQFVLRKPLGRGLSGVLYAIYRRSGLIKLHKTYSHLVTSALTMGFGGSAGLEAPMINTSSAFGSNMGQFLRLDHGTRNVLIGAGAAAAISAMYNAPIAGVIFTLEILLMELNITRLIPILLAAVAGTLVSNILNGAEIIIPATLEGHFAIELLPWMIALGVFTALVSFYFSSVTSRIEERFLKIGRIRYRMLIGGLLLGLLVFLFPPLFGEGFETIRMIMNGQASRLAENSVLHWYLDTDWSLVLFFALVLLFKVFATTFTISGGGNGGYFAPALFCGAIAGFLFARIVNLTELGPGLNEATFALVGMAGMISGIMHAPFTAIFFIAEITQGYSLIVPLMVVSAIAYLTNIYFEPHSIFTKQVDRKVHQLMTDRDSRILNHLHLRQVLETDLKTIQLDKNLGALVELVAVSHRNIFPVIEQDGALVGIITLDDIRNLMFKPDRYETTEVSQLVHPPPAIVEINEGMDVAMRRFEETGAWNLPVTEDGRYVGMISKSKIFNVYRDLLRE